MNLHKLHWFRLGLFRGDYNNATAAALMQGNSLYFTSDFFLVVPAYG